MMNDNSEILSRMRAEIEKATEKIIKRYEKKYGISIERTIVKPHIASIETPERYMKVR